MTDTVIFRLLLVSAIWLYFADCTSQPSLEQPSPEPLINEYMQVSKAPGVFVAVVRGDSVLYEKSFGVTDIQTGMPMTDTTCMELGSISKAFTAEVIYALHHKRLLNINDPIRKYFTDAPSAWSNITVHHLLKHTSGIRNYLEDPRFKAAEYFQGTTDTTVIHFFRNVTTDSLVKMFYSLPVEFPPGISWAYSNTGYILLGKIAEQITGKNFFELVKETFTDPLQMYQTSTNDLATKEGCLAKGYFLFKDSIKTSPVLTANYAFSAGAWASSGRDMIKYIKAIHQKRLPADNNDYNWRHVSPYSELPFTYDGGHFFTTYHGMKIIFHGGGTPGFTSSWMYVADKNISIIILTNRQDYAAIEPLAWNVLSLFEPILKYPTKKRNGAAENKYAEIVGAFVNAIKKDSTLPQGLAKPLQIFLQTENGKGLWKWVFERGFPDSVYCVDAENVKAGKIYRFHLLHSDKLKYTLSILVNSTGEVVQILLW